MQELKPLLNDTWTFYKAHFVGLCSIILPFVIPLDFFYAVIDHYGDTQGYGRWLALIPGVLVLPIYQGALILYIASAISGEPIPRKQCYQLALRFWLPLMLLYIIMTVAICAGLLLLIIPGLIVLARVTFSEFYCILYEEKAINAFRLSWNKTEKYQGLILGGLLVIVLITTIPVWLVEKIIIVLDAWNPMFTFLSGIVSSILAIPLTIFGFRVFTMHQETVKTTKKELGTEKND